MLFQKNIEPRCTYCQRGTPLDEEKILCTKQGVVAPGGSCRSFKYDPLKRVPRRAGDSPFSTTPAPAATRGGGGFPRYLRLCMAGAR